MRDYSSIGPTPGEEPCAQVGEVDYRATALNECRRFIRLLRKTFGPEPRGAALSIKSWPHDLGIYYEVVCSFDTDIQESVDYAYRCEAETPVTWEEGDARAQDRP